MLSRWGNSSERAANLLNHTWSMEWQPESLKQIQLPRRPHMLAMPVNCSTLDSALA